MRNPQVRVKAAKELLDYCEELLCDIDLEKEYQNNILHAKPPAKPKEAEADLMEEEEEIMPAAHPNMQTFTDALEGVESMLEALLTLFEESALEDIEEEDYEEEGEGEWDSHGRMEAEEELTQGFLNFVNDHLKELSRNLFLTCSEGQNIAHLTLRAFAACRPADR
jgi:hypothetical protein